MHVKNTTFLMSWQAWDASPRDRELTHRFEDDVQTMADWVLEHELWPKRRPAVLAELETARQGGARLILASGTYAPLAQGMAALNRGVCVTIQFVSWPP